MVFVLAWKKVHEWMVAGMTDAKGIQTGYGLTEMKQWVSWQGLLTTTADWRSISSDKYCGEIKNNGLVLSDF